MRKLISAIALAVSLAACGQSHGNGTSAAPGYQNTGASTAAQAAWGKSADDYAMRRAAQTLHQMLTSGFPELGPQSIPYAPSDNVSGNGESPATSAQPHGITIVKTGSTALGNGDTDRGTWFGDPKRFTGIWAPRASDSGWTY
jgi:hypothetical protein